jgi:uncharacterized protein
MNTLKFIVVGIFFGIVMTKSEVISWFRIQEMFLFQSFHMYGIIAVAVCLGALEVLLIKKMKFMDYSSKPIVFVPKKKGVVRYLLGGIIFGLGWAMTGACPGPMYTLVGHGLPVFVVVIMSALLGTLTYGAVRSKLPH